MLLSFVSMFSAIAADQMPRPPVVEHGDREFATACNLAQIGTVLKLKR